MVQINCRTNVANQVVRASDHSACLVTAKPDSENKFYFHFMVTTTQVLP